MLLFFLIAVDGVLGATHAARVVLGGVGGLRIDMGLQHGHDTDILREVVFAGEVADVVPVDPLVVNGFARSLILSDVDELGAGQGRDLAKDLHHASLVGRYRQPGQLLLHFVGDAGRPPTHLVIDQANILLAFLQALKLELQLLILVLQVGVLGLFGLHHVSGRHQVPHLLLVCEGRLFVVGWRALDLSPILARHRQVLHLFPLLIIESLQLIVLLFILIDGDEERRVGLFFRHELLHDLTDI